MKMRRRESREEGRGKGSYIMFKCQQVKQQLGGQGSLSQSIGTHGSTGMPFV